MKTRSVLWLLLTLGLMMLASTAAQAVGVGKLCGGFAGIQCNPGLFCQHKAGSCFIGCDGKTYGNDCERQAASVSKSHDGKCI